MWCHPAHVRYPPNNGFVTAACTTFHPTACNAMSSVGQCSIETGVLKWCHVRQHVAGGIWHNTKPCLLQQYHPLCDVNDEKCE